MIITNTVKMRINCRNYKHYIDKGYIFLHNEVIEIDVNDLTPGSIFFIKEHMN